MPETTRGGGYVQHLEFHFVFKADGVGVGLAIVAMLVAIVCIECMSFLQFPFHSCRTAYLAKFPIVVDFCREMWGASKMLDFVVG